MGKTWVLDTDTKGTGARVVPLARATKRSSPAEPVFVPREPVVPREPQAPEPRPPHRFKLVDVMTRQTLLEDANARETVDVLSRIRSIVDVEAYIWVQESARWRLLPLSDQRAMWELGHSGKPSRAGQS